MKMTPHQWIFEVQLRKSLRTNIPDSTISVRQSGDEFESDCESLSYSGACRVQRALRTRGDDEEFPRENDLQRLDSPKSVLI